MPPKQMRPYSIPQVSVGKTGPQRAHLRFAMDIPIDIWLLIFDMLPSESVRALMLVHRMFFNHARRLLWRSLLLCTMDDRHRTKTRAILRDPTLASQVRHVILEPTRYRRDMPTNLWTCDPSIQTWKDIAKLMTWQHPLKPWKHFLRSREDIELTTEVVPLLTNVRKVSIITWDENIRPDPEPYRKIWKGLSAEHLQCLSLYINSGTALVTFSDVLQTSAITFEHLQTFSLALSIGGSYSTSKFQQDVKVIVGLGIHSVRCLRLDIRFRRDILQTLLDGLGFFPNLIHFDCRFQGDWTVTANDSFTLNTGFLREHMSTLSCLKLASYVSHLFPLTPFAVAPLKLSYLQLICSGALTWPWITQGLNMERYADTLTTLIISLSQHQASGLHYDAVAQLVLGLHKPQSGTLLRRLQLPVQFLSPEILDLLSNHLENLHTLEIVYGNLVATLVLFIEEVGQFWWNVGTRNYENWKLRSFVLRPAATKVSRLLSGGLSESQTQNALSKLVPSLESFGPIDWSDEHDDFDS
ncbi:hypothetical protein BDN72DRAFT_490961 [Pluteus cervinus]|uniref:Uncharacterized protein n=1 Tax=Pluteus cervinus TaxID=181527 RepID=A0ACD3A5L4_9AGAR|nr:hypothetical protein BDN72DRAFT_490961 [Pluteus cervinus]